MAASNRLVVIAALASAVLLWLASPVVGFGWLGWVALVPVAAATLAAQGRRAGRLAVPLAYTVHLELLIVPAFPFGLAEGQWGDPVVPVLVGDSPVIAIALVAIPLLGALLYLVRFGQPWGASKLPGPAATVATVAIPALAWTALDFARAKIDPGGLWGPLFLSQADQPAGALATLAGPWSITLVLVAVNYAIAVGLVHRRARLAAVSIAATVALVLAGTAVERAGDREPPVRVAAIQPGYDTAEDEQPQLRFFRQDTYHLAALDLVRDLGELTREAAADGARIVVWPEASMYVDPRGEPDVRRAIDRLVRRTRVSIVIPFFLPRPLATGKVVAVEPAPEGARFTQARPKHRPLWIIGENRAELEPGPIAVAGHEIGVLLGTDTQDARHAATLTAEGASLLASATHDWRQSAAPARAYARLAARAARVPLVRADWRYRSAIFTARGEVVADAGADRERLALVAEVRPASGPSPYARIGDVLGWIAIGAVGLIALTALVSLARRRRASAGATPPAER